MPSTSAVDQFNERTIAEFRASHGRVGDTFDGAPLLLLHTVGARSGQPRVNPVMYLADGDRYLVFASKAGADANPGWYWNLRANPDAAIEVGDETFAVRATELTGAERDEKYRIQSERYPGFAGYRQKTSRAIPVIALTRRDAPPAAAGPMPAVDVESGQFPRRGLPSQFGLLLLGYRRAAGLTQEDLASKAGIHVRTLRNLERGSARGAQQRSAAALCEALGLAEGQRTEFLPAAKSSRRQSSGISLAVATVPPSVTALCAVPAMMPDFVGRDAQLDKLRSWSSQARDASSGMAVAVVGPAGVGKTSLAVAAAHQLASEFPDGCLAVDLRGMDEHPVSASTALERMLRSLGVNPSQIPPTVAEQSSVYRSMLADRRMLVLLDNVSDEAHTRPLLATQRGCLTLITCRRSLSGLEGIRWLWLGPLGSDDAVELVASIVTPERVRAEPQAARELVEQCGNQGCAPRSRCPITGCPCRLSTCSGGWPWYRAPTSASNWPRLPPGSSIPMPACRSKSCSKPPWCKPRPPRTGISSTI
ncbi:MAG: nitroreductase/quinone reductase family protein [Trebonia sp.]|jgi:deazaflavin-dependent oxidoreductase (nitroreductase family)